MNLQIKQSIQVSRLFWACNSVGHKYRLCLRKNPYYDIVAFYNHWKYIIRTYVGNKQLCI
jgi:hypothetical protein